MPDEHSQLTLASSQPLPLEHGAFPLNPARPRISVGAVPFIRYRADLVACLSLLLITGLIAWQRVWFWNGLAYLDVATFYLPWYAHLGEALRSFDIPGWNPYQFSGTPFAGDPQSGWMYVPAMFFFSVLKPVAAYQWFLAFHLALAAFSTYAYARVVGLKPISASTAAIAFAFGPLVSHVSCCLIHVQLAVWIPPALLGIEIGQRAGGRASRFAGHCLAGIAVSQMLAGWIGQGAYYGLLVVATYIVFRTLIAPIDPTAVRSRVLHSISTGALTFGMGFGLAAAGLLPRLDAIRGTNVSGGEYTGTGSENYASGWSIPLMFDRLMREGFNYYAAVFYLGAATLTLSFMALVLSRNKSVTPYFLGLTIVTSILALERVTPVHQLFYLLPRFEVLHEHVPTRVVAVQWLGPAMLAGATVDALLRGPQIKQLRTAALVPILIWTAILGWLAIADRTIGVATVLLVLAMCIGTAVTSLPRFQALPRTRTVLAVLLLFAVLLEPAGSTFVRAVWMDEPDPVVALPTGPVEREAIETNAAATDPGGAGEFLQQQLAAGDYFRYFGYDPEYFAGGWSWPSTYREFYWDPTVQALLVNARAMRLELFDVQGYNPVQLSLYVQALNAANRSTQNYHDAQILESGITSPMLDMLNVRYIVIPNQIPPGRPRYDLLYLTATHKEVFRNAEIRVLENANALPRAWVVHETRKTTEEGALWLISSGTTDPSETVILPTNTQNPKPSVPPDGATESVVVRDFQPDEMLIDATLAAPGLVVVSESYDPGWKAYVDGVETPIYLADGVLRAVSVPAGVHTIEMRFEPHSLQLGLWITGLTAAAIVATFLLLKRRSTGR